MGESKRQNGFVDEKMKTTNFKIINAGMPKTASKSCTAAMEILGFKVADVGATFMYFSKDWLDYFNGEVSISDLIEKYDEMGFNMNNDLPGNWQWETLYDNIDDAKVILTVRDTEDKWEASWKNFCKAQVNKNGIWGTRIAPILARLGLLGSLQNNFDKLMLMFLRGLLGVRLEKQKLWKHHFETTAEMNSDFLKDKYVTHNANVIKKVPKHRLLIWNLKDGWEPICKFLDIPIPEQPFPVLNKTTDPLFFDRLRMDLRKGLPWNEWFQLVVPTLTMMLLIYLVIPMAVSYFIYRCL